MEPLLDPTDLFEKTLSLHKKKRDLMNVHTINGVRLTGYIEEYNFGQKLLILRSENGMQTVVNFDNVTSYTKAEQLDHADVELARYHRQKNRNTL